MAQLPAGMRNNNPGNIKYIGQAGTTPSVNTDQGDPQAVYASPEAGMRAMYELLQRKYAGGKTTPAAIIAGQGGWTPGNVQAAANIARTMGIDVNADIGLADPTRAAKFMRALMLQEHGQASNAYTDEQIAAAIGGGPVTTTDSSAPVAAADGSDGSRPPPPPPSDDIFAAAAEVPRSRLAETLSSSIGRRSGGGQQPAFDSGSPPPAPPIEFAKATPEFAPPAAPVVAPVAEDGGLASLFKVRDIGGAGKIDPVTGQPLLPRMRRV